MKTDAKGNEMPKLKLGEDGKPEIANGKLILVLDDGKETEFDAVGVYSTLGKIRDERDEWKGKAEATEAELAKFGKTADERNAAAEKIRLAGNIDAKKLIDAGKVDEVVNERLNKAKEEWEAEKTALSSKAEQLSAKLRRNLVSKQIASSKVFDDYNLTARAFEAIYGQHFDVEGDEDHVVAFADPGRKSKLYKPGDPTKLASIDDAISILLKADPEHDKWKKSSQATGTGAPGNPNPGDSSFDALPPDERLARGLARTA